MEMTRRELLGSMGFLAATSALPTLADVPSFFPERGRFERLTLGYQRIEAGATKPFSILHISDTHLTAAGLGESHSKQILHRQRTKTFGGRQEEALRDSLEWAKANADYVLHTGDLIDWQSEENFELVKKYFGANVFGALGNHEYSPDMWLSDPKETRDEANKARTRAAVAATYPFDVELQSKVINGVNFVTMDDVYGYVTERQVERFAAEEKKGLPIILCMHVPFFTEKIWQAHEKFWGRSGRRFVTAAIPKALGDYKAQLEDVVTRDFIAHLKGQPLLKGILAGHLHLSVQDRFSPTAMEYVVGGNFLFHGQEVLVV